MSGSISASATVVGTSIGNGKYSYTVTLNDTGTTPIGTFWFSWVPGLDFMNQNPTLIGSPTGWTDNVFTSLFGGGTGYSIQWVANSAASDIPAGGSSSAFTFTSSETPQQMATNSPFVPNTPTTTSFVYQDGPLTPTSAEFVAGVTLNENGSATIAGTPAGGGAFNYTITLTDTGNTTIGTFWFAWDDVPDQDFMNQLPGNISDPVGWTHVVTTHSYPGGTGYGIEWLALSAGAALNPGDISSAFKFSSIETPADMAAISPFQINGSTFQTTSSFVYSGGALATPGGNLVVQVACFRDGTRIRTPSGDVGIEALRPGDGVVTSTGEVRGIIWAGARRLVCAQYAHPHLLWPVRIAAGALGGNLPTRDLWLSPDHALFLDGVLIPVRCLINHTSIVPVPMDVVTWHHLELDSHDVILAEGAPAESYLRTSGREGFFGGGTVTAIPGHGLMSREANSRFPLVVTGPILSAVRNRLIRLALSEALVRAA
jgi:hypothetical protein